VQFPTLTVAPFHTESKGRGILFLLLRLPKLSLLVLSRGTWLRGTSVRVNLTPRGTVH